MKSSALILRTIGVGLIGMCLAALHCGGGISGYCEERIACEGGNDADQEACEIDFGAQQEIADIKGCAPEWDAIRDCIEERVRCNAKKYVINDKDCLQEADRYSKCTR